LDSPGPEEQTEFLVAGVTGVLALIDLTVGGRKVSKADRKTPTAENFSHHNVNKNIYCTESKPSINLFQLKKKNIENTSKLFKMLDPRIKIRRNYPNGLRWCDFMA